MTVSQWLMLALKASIMLTVFATGLAATVQDASFLFRRPALLARAFVSMNVVMPVIAFVIASASSLPFVVKVALVALSVSPVPPIIQKKQLKAGGRMEYVVGLLVAMSLLAIVVVPLAVLIANRLYGGQAVLPPVAIGKIILTTVLLPLVLGLLVRNFIPAAAKAAHVVGAVAGIMLAVAVIPLLYSMWPVVQPLLRDGTVLVMLGMAAVGLLVGHVLGGPRAADRTALAISTASRHPAVALAVATSGTAAGALETKPALAAILTYVLVSTIVCLPYQKLRARADNAPEAAR